MDCTRVQSGRDRANCAHTKKTTMPCQKLLDCTMYLYILMLCHQMFLCVCVCELRLLTFVHTSALYAYCRGVDDVVLRCHIRAMELVVCIRAVLSKRDAKHSQKASACVCGLCTPGLSIGRTLCVCLKLYVRLTSKCASDHAPTIEPNAKNTFTQTHSHLDKIVQV